MKRGIGLALFSALSVACLFAYTFHARNSSTEGSRPNLRAKAEPTARQEQSIENSLEVNLEEANASADEPTPRRLAARARARHAAAAAHQRGMSPEETAGAIQSTSGGGGELVVSPTQGACAPDSFTVQPCSFEEWTYTFPQD